MKKIGSVALVHEVGFPLAKTVLAFAGGPQISIPLGRQCSVRG